METTTKWRFIMKLVTYEHLKSGPRAGVIQGEDVIDITQLLGSTVAIRDVGALLQHGENAINDVRKALSENQVTYRVALNKVRLLSPILQPPTIRDYAAFEVHARNAIKNSGLTELPARWYEKATFYFSNPSTVCGPDAEVIRPSACKHLDYEVEIGIVIGKEGRDIPEEEAMDYIAGFTIYNDWSDRELCTEEFGFLGFHKAKDFAQGFGPWMVTTDELMDKYVDGRLQLKVTAKINGDVWTDSTTGDMYWSIPYLIARASKDSRLVPGDIIGTGTVGLGCIYERPDELRWLEDGDVVEIDAEGIGTLRQTVRSKSVV
jgi:2-keto-4-pentenoate hydratase/2-oxohepta-3-ene-1,7-dioic acid hydratase in catechol pathway